ncbi:membrane hypothetical protein [groundwater metagenome]|uniref:Uncharacterized protein n=1 Tax=groundwater metagenome TaxID=717931 RepID=A0A098E5Y8_9ZZZZ
MGKFNIKENANFGIYAFFVMISLFIIAKIFVYQISIFERVTSVPEIYLIIPLIITIILIWLSKTIVQKTSNNESHGDIVGWLVGGLLFIFWPIWVPIVFNSI